MQDNTPILDFETCERIGYDTEETILANTQKQLNRRHPSENGMSYYDVLALDIYHSEELLSAGDTPAKVEVMDIIREEYRKQDELKRHCLFLYLGSGDNIETEIVNDLTWHFEEVLIDRAADLLAPGRTNPLMN